MVEVLGFKVIYSSPPVSAGDTFQDLLWIVVDPIQVNFRSTKVDAGKLKHKYLNQPWSTLAVNVLIYLVRSTPQITETVDTESADTGVLLYVN
jgi:hypothetical protein